jgi:hypothetical protein
MMGTIDFIQEWLSDTTIMHLDTTTIFVDEANFARLCLSKSFQGTCLVATASKGVM